MQDQPHLDPILTTLTEHDVAFVVLDTGRLAITPARSRGNLDRLAAALTELAARVRTTTHPEGRVVQLTAHTLGDDRLWTLRTPFGDLDLVFVPDGTFGYDDLVRDADPTIVAGVGVRVAVRPRTPSSD